MITRSKVVVGMVGPEWIRLKSLIRTAIPWPVDRTPGAMAAKLKELQSDLSTLKDVTLENARRCKEIWATRWIVRLVCFFFLRGGGARVYMVAKKSVCEYWELGWYLLILSLRFNPSTNFISHLMTYYQFFSYCQCCMTLKHSQIAGPCRILCS